MQPNQSNNYWQPEPKEEVLGMYTPSPVADEPIVRPQPLKPQIAEADQPVRWRAEEYIHQEKDKTWFFAFAAIAIAMILVDLLLLKSYTFSVLVIVMAVSVVIYSRRPPRTIDYVLSGRQGLYVGNQLYHFSDFRAFGLIRDQDHNSIMLIPTKRFAPGVSVYFPDEVGEKVIDILGARLPMNNLKLDLIDIIVRQLRL